MTKSFIRFNSGLYNQTAPFQVRIKKDLASLYKLLYYVLTSQCSFCIQRPLSKSICRQQKQKNCLEVILSWKSTLIYPIIYWHRKKLTNFCGILLPVAIAACWWCSGANFINVICIAYARAEPKSVKVTVKSSIFSRFWVWELQA